MKVKIEDVKIALKNAFFEIKRVMPLTHISVDFYEKPDGTDMFYGFLHFNGEVESFDSLEDFMGKFKRDEVLYRKFK